MQRFDEIIEQATAAVAKPYFLLPVHGAKVVFRERVYCYELYHQMRCRWPEDCPYLLNGELDKQRHPYFEDGWYPKPDFLVHIPGTGYNFAAMEVKPGRASADNMLKDIQTLLYFHKLYERVLYLIYGVHPDKALERVAACTERAELPGAIELWVHHKPGTPAQRIA